MALLPLSLPFSVSRSLCPPLSSLHRPSHPPPPHRTLSQRRSRAQPRTGLLCVASSSPFSTSSAAADLSLPVVKGTPDGPTGLAGFRGLNHVAVCVENLETSLSFYCGLLGAWLCAVLRCSPTVPPRTAASARALRSVL